MKPGTVFTVVLIIAGAMAIYEDGVQFRAGSMIKMTFDHTKFESEAFQEIRVTFQTIRKQGILLQYRDETNYRVVSLSINNNGGVKFSVDVGNMKWEMNTVYADQDLTDGRFHEIVLTRRAHKNRFSSHVSIKVDPHPEITNRYRIRGVDRFLANAPYLFIGNNQTESYGYGQFYGCISNVQIDNFNVLHTAFTSPTPPHIEVQLTDGQDGVFEECETSTQNPLDGMTTDSFQTDSEPTYCPAGFEPHESMCFRYINSEQTWINAAEYCEVMDARLVSVDDEDENTFVTEFVTRSTDDSDTMVWTDATNVQGEFMWIKHNRSVSFAGWAPGHPRIDRHDISCVVHDGGLLYAISCGRRRKFVCEIELDGEGSEEED